MVFLWMCMFFLGIVVNTGLLSLTFKKLIQEHSLFHIIHYVLKFIENSSKPK